MATRAFSLAGWRYEMGTDFERSPDALASADSGGEARIVNSATGALQNASAAA